ALAGRMIREAGAVVSVCSAEVHDRAMARLVSAPLATAAALAVAGADAGDLLAAAGPGFRDSTRLAETPADLAVELLLGNPGEARAAIRSVLQALAPLAAAVDRR